MDIAVKHYAVVDSATKKVSNFIEVPNDWNAPEIEGVEYIWISPEFYENNLEQKDSMYKNESGEIEGIPDLINLELAYHNKKIEIDTFYNTKKRYKNIQYSGQEYIDIEISPEKQIYLGLQVSQYDSLITYENQSNELLQNNMIFLKEFINEMNNGTHVEIPSIKKLLAYIVNHERVCLEIYSQKIVELNNLYIIADPINSKNNILNYNPENNYPNDLIINIGN